MGISKKFENTQYITLSNLMSMETFNIIDLSRKKGAEEVFVHFEFREEKSVYGYAVRTPFMNEMFKRVFQENYNNQNIHFIEWDDRFLVCFNDGICISTHYCFVTKEEVFQFVASLRDNIITGVGNANVIDFWETDYIEVDCETQLYGDWLQDEQNKYYPDPSGQFAMIYDNNNNVYQVLRSTHAIRCNKCSPCYPNQGDIDTEGRLLAYCLPSDLLDEKWVKRNKHRIIKL